MEFRFLCYNFYEHLIKSESYDLMIYLKEKDTMKIM